MTKRDIFTVITEYIKQLYEVCDKAGIYLHPITTYTIESEEKYKVEQSVWEKAETYEIYCALDEESLYYKGNKITKNEIIDFMIDWGLETSKG